MISLVRFGSRQYHVTLGTRLRVEKLDVPKGKTWTSNQILATQDRQGNLTIGTPLVEKAQIKARVVRHGKAKKIIILKKKRRKGYRRTQGHRQQFTELFVEALSDVNGKWETAKVKPASKKANAKTATQQESTELKTKAKPTKKQNNEKKLTKTSVKQTTGKKE